MEEKNTVFEPQISDIRISGSIIKVATLKAEKHYDVENPERVINSLQTGAAGVDIFTFMQRIPYTQPKFNYPMELDNVAAIPITSYDHWWHKQINAKTRNMVRKAGKKGLTIKTTPFNDTFVKGIHAIYNESPIRQGRPFWHYGKSAARVKKENASYASTSDFIGAYLDDELVGFIKVVHVDRYSYIMQIVSKLSHRDKAPTNGLLAEAVKICAEKSMPYLIYSKFSYGKKGSDSLAAFKKHNGFEKIDLPRYYIPLTTKGRIALKLNLYNGFTGLLPTKLVTFLLKIRGRWYARRA